MAKNRELPVGWYLVAFVDVLGQSKLLRQMRVLPDETNQRQMQEFIDLLNKTAGVVKSLRDVFHSFFEGYGKLNTDLKSYMFSDFVVFFLSLGENKTPFEGIFAVLASGASTLLMMLSGGHAIRGGIDIGIGIELSDGDVYGAALAKAYDLESKTARYPRIVIGDNLFNYIHKNAKQNINVLRSTNDKTAYDCTRLLGIDDDGLPFLDYLGEGFKQDIAKNCLRPGTVKRAYDFVMHESARCKRDKEPKLAFRYSLLRNYFEHRMYLWHE
jgi:hypothetical protein